MGSLLQKFLPCPIETASNDKETLDLIPRVDVLMIGVPIQDTLEILEKIAPLMREDQLLLDITSLKMAPCAAMLKAKCSVIGMHPLFGPSIDTLQGKHLAFCPVRPGPWKEIVLSWFQGAEIIETTPEHHDEMMAMTQALVHFINMAFITLLKEKMPLKELSPFATPTYDMQLNLARRILSGSPALYASIQRENSFFPAILDHLEQVIADLKKLVLQPDSTEFHKKFEELSTYV
ncbi:MAG: prephenate dehydrogenase/arogenate dehydrogenase family protein [Simkaniaceae bacterium]|nr:prephenate dehydrogenase/arogenate dehydrogenase family protein [Simkaniaceae bacterium]